MPEVAEQAVTWCAFDRNQQKLFWGEQLDIRADEWSFLSITSLSSFFLFPTMGWCRASIWNLGTAQSMNCSFCSLWTPLALWRVLVQKKEGCRLDRQLLIESLHRGQLWRNHVQRVLVLLTQLGWQCLKKNRGGKNQPPPFTNLHPILNVSSIFTRLPYVFLIPRTNSSLRHTKKP